MPDNFLTAGLAKAQALLHLPGAADSAASATASTASSLTASTPSRSASSSTGLYAVLGVVFAAIVAGVYFLKKGGKRRPQKVRFK